MFSPSISMVETKQRKYKTKREKPLPEHSLSLPSPLPLSLSSLCVSDWVLHPSPEERESVWVIEWLQRTSALIKALPSYSFHFNSYIHSWVNYFASFFSDEFVPTAYHLAQLGSGIWYSFSCSQISFCCGSPPHCGGPQRNLGVPLFVDFLPSFWF